MLHLISDALLGLVVAVLFIRLRNVERFLDALIDDLPED